MTDDRYTKKSLKNNEEVKKDPLYDVYIDNIASITGLSKENLDKVVMCFREIGFTNYNYKRR